MYSTLAIVVTFNPKLLDLISLLKWSKNEPIKLLVVDNGSFNLCEISHQLIEYPELEFINLKHNYGLAYAQNIGLKYALKHRFEFALLLDQDSLPQTGFVQRALQAFKISDPQGAVVAAVAPRFFDAQTGYLYPFVRFGRLSVVVFEPSQTLENISLLISSGSMLRVSVLDKIGLMNELFFIDHIDTEWCLRAIHKGFRLVGVADNLMRHSVGDSTIHMFGRYLPVHSPARRYFATRNLYYLIFYENASLPWKLKEFVSSIAKLAISIMKNKDRYSHVRSFFLGVWDGISSNFSRVLKNEKH